MAGQTSIKSDIAKEYLLKFPNTANLTLAKKIYAENKILYKDVEEVRSHIRALKGVHGVRNKQERHVEFRKQYDEFKKQFELLKEELPKGETDKIEPYYLPKSNSKVLMLSDIHFPYQNDDALFAALEYGKQKEVDTIWLNGDTMDIYSLSKFDKDPRKRNFKYEIDLTRKFLKGLRAMFPKALIIFKMGNHENRWEAFLRNKAVELLDMEEFKLSVILHFNELNIQLIEDKQMGYCGELKVLHYHELPLKSGGVNPARAVYLKTGESVIGGHYHRKSEHVERTLGGKLVKVYSTACLCDLFAGYMPYNNWSHGFAYIEVKPNGDYMVENKTIIDEKIF